MPNKIKPIKSGTKTTLDDVLSAVNDGFTGVEQRFQKLENRFGGLENRFDGLDKKVDSIDKRLTKVESQMVTKEYLDDKLADLRGDLVIMVRKEDTKLKKLVDILEQRQVISVNERESIFALEPFAQS